MDLVDMSNADAKRLVDFAAGLAFALRGSFDKVATKVFLLAPPTSTCRPGPSANRGNRLTAIRDTRRRPGATGSSVLRQSVGCD